MLAAGLLAKKAVERGLDRESCGQDFARSRLARGHRLSHQDRAPDLSRPARLPDRRLRLHDVHRQLRSAASRASKSDREERSDRRQRALRQPQLRGARASEHQSELPDVAAAGRRLRARRPRGYRSHDRAARPIARTAQTFTSATSGRRSRRFATRCRARSSPKSSAGSTPISPSRIRSGTRSRAPSARSTSGTTVSTYIQEPPFFNDFCMEPGTFSEIKGARPLGIFGD